MGRKVIPFEEGDSDSPIRLRLIADGDEVNLVEVDSEGEQLDSGVICVIDSRGLRMTVDYVGSLPTEGRDDTVVVRPY